MTMPSFGISFGKSSSSGTGALSYDYEKGEYFEGCISEEAREYLRFMNKLYAEAVSYTHLDVYKRQVYTPSTSARPAQTQPGGGAQICAAQANPSISHTRWLNTCRAGDKLSLIHI